MDDNAKKLRTCGLYTYLCEKSYKYEANIYPVVCDITDFLFMSVDIRLTF
jgi:hypothetical protein